MAYGRFRQSLPYFRVANVSGNRGGAFAGFSVWPKSRIGQMRAIDDACASIEIHVMKTLTKLTTEMFGAANGLKASRFQIYRQTRAGSYVAGFQSNSASDAIEAFLSATPLFDGGELRVWDRLEQKAAASVVWSRERTDFGFAVRHRTNVFHNRLLGFVARQIQDREAIRHEMQRNVGTTV